ncbi:MAG: flap endonuclease-1 [Candidatus Hadarchaeales archaeon]
MGVQLGDVVPKKKIGLEDLRGKKIAVDAMNFLYQFLSIIRQRDGELLRDSKGRITSHLSGLFYRTANFIEAGILPIYVFDGEPPKLKQRTVEERRALRAKAEEEWARAVAEGRIEDARKFAQRAGRVDQRMIDQAKELLEYMGVPWVQAPGEGEAQAAYLVSKGDAWAVGSQDFDALLFGSPTLIRNLAITGRRKLPGKDVYIEVEPEVVELEGVLRGLGITREQLIDMGILIGTDFNEGVKGIGPKKALELIREKGSIKAMMNELGEKFEVDPLEVREVFLKPAVTSNYTLRWRDPDPEKIKRFLCGEYDFSDSRVQTGIEKLLRGKCERGQASLERWLG